MRSGRILPEHVDLGLRLTVGEGVLKKPFLQSTHGEGHFPEMSARTEPSNNAYFPGNPALAGGGFPGTYYFIDGVGNHCSKFKMKAEIAVNNDCKKRRTRRRIKRRN